MTINIQKLFKEMPNTILDNQRKIDIDTKVKVFYGLSKEGLLRISFLSSCRPHQLESTKLIRVLQLNESEDVYWTCFDLLDNNAESAYYLLIEDLIQSIMDCATENSCLLTIKNRFLIWKKMLGRANPGEMSEEKVKGLFGELYFLYNYMTPKYGIKDSVSAWGGPNDNSKDFTILNDWYEVKTIGTSVNEVKISSLTQLDSDIPGKLTIIRVESMSEVYTDGMSSLEELVTKILNSTDDLSVKELFVSKLDKLKYSPVDSSIKMKYKVHNLDLYTVNDEFPRICLNDVKYQEICKVTYSIYIKAIEKFKDVK